LILGHFRSYFGGVHQFWASVAKRMDGWGVGQDGWGGKWQQLVKICPEKLHSEDKDTRAHYS